MFLAVVNFLLPPHGLHWTAMFCLFVKIMTVPTTTERVAYLCSSSMPQLVGVANMTLL